MLSKPRRIQLTESLFDQFQKNGERYRTQNLYALVLTKPGEISRFVVIVPKKLDKRATKRNSARRSVFRVIHRLYSMIIGGKQVLIGINNLDITEEEVVELLTVSGLL